MDARDFYDQHGYWLQRGLLSDADCDRLLSEGMALIAGDDTPNRIMQPHRDNSCFRDYFADERLLAPLRTFAGEDIIGTQTMFYIKPPGSTGHGWHQDNFYITGRPKPCCAAWCALDRITGENGGLTVFPGSHRSREHLPMLPHDNPNFRNHATCIQPPADAEEMLVEMSRGDVLFFDGYLIHGSYPNQSTRDTRPAFIGHYVPAGSIQPDTHGDRVRFD